jgi:carboxymethylenebutenolidase
VHNVPTLTGGDGRAGVVDFYTHHFVGKMPADTRIERISRTVGSDQVVDELIMYFTHASRYSPDRTQSSLTACCRDEF